MTHLRFGGAAALLGAALVALGLPGCSDPCPESYDCFLGEFSLEFGGGLTANDVATVTTSSACEVVGEGSCDAGVSSCDASFVGSSIDLMADKLGDCAITLHLKSGAVLDATAHITELDGACCSGLVGSVPVVLPKHP